MPTIKYTGPDELSPPIDLGAGRALVCRKGQLVTVDAATARIAAAAVADSRDWTISGRMTKSAPKRR